MEFLMLEFDEVYKCIYIYSFLTLKQQKAICKKKKKKATSKFSILNNTLDLN